jgi:hypothetical protein
MEAAGGAVGNRVQGLRFCRVSPVKKPGRAAKSGTDAGAVVGDPSSRVTLT